MKQHFNWIINQKKKRIFSKTQQVWLKIQKMLKVQIQNLIYYQNIQQLMQKKINKKAQQNQRYFWHNYHSIFLNVLLSQLLLSKNWKMCLLKFIHKQIQWIFIWTRCSLVS
ncbi:hypothetical protein TTHERM_000101229 (macronuclear) [Tetrahymena thermophila SB210]|uniref:Uncharacterized protein n=1 Tax=Tetrahymena thermophila (strain SB210) TaxID=312017 RepID=W7XKZ4_TETTS|nr:hypothetical protein TTHERM_000101229 [Tetrahymena thermophila SB210]EWS75394.1 hypothetical protein TTHERM_000101229 [Tetrahymena thermophila SB210]|eukprot:XP_012652068.1 hypothetical protein TTHERM_000101229 [Tetrahymena thermophila SB210]